MSRSFFRKIWFRDDVDQNIFNMVSGPVFYIVLIVNKIRVLRLPLKRHFESVLELF